MEKEPHHPGQSDIPLTGIYLDIPRKTLIFAAQHEVVASIRLAPEGLVFKSGQQEPAIPPRQASDALQSGSQTEPQPAETEKPKTATLQGKLKSKPIKGRTDSRGNPTAWARFAAHEEDHDGAHLYSATFHKHTAPIALGLDADAPLTVQGYPHEHADPGSRRMDTLSVINLLDYPGKPAK